MKVIINADDFGMDKNTTDAIINAFDAGYITDTTMVANGSAFQYACTLLQNHQPMIPVGIHFNITEGVPLTKEMQSCRKLTKQSHFNPKHGNPRLNRHEKQILFAELCAQVERLRDENICISHADSHHHSHTVPRYTGVFLKVCKKYGITRIRISQNVGQMSRLKHALKAIIRAWYRLQGFQVTDYFGDAEDAACFLKQQHTGSIEVMVHPDYDIDGNLIDRKKRLDGHSIGEQLEAALKFRASHTMTDYRNS